ncbi:ribosome maturation factor RimM [Paludibacterium paludis]|uniref:Ribosome maturation factor RimM n=1 Tax=Paludibacterium paludis TaxID=1225769 RepID=A0A918P5H4_9NEIS|nr:ribosome maturation factor RimM [Paludibacterium paludis]GGY25998.1 ribosome maturation factor RimM [Paludibacterium paludis]
MRDDELVVMGYVSGAFGVRGWVKVHADTEFEDSLFDYPEWLIGKNGVWKTYRFEDGAVQPKALVAKLEGVADRDAADSLKGSQVAILRDQLPEPDDDEYYWADLIGLDVVNRSGQALGKVTKLLGTGAHDILVVHDGKTERMIPFVEQFVGKVDIEAGTIEVDWGLDF